MTILVPLLTLLLGAGLGFLSSLLLERHRQANTVAAKVIDVYLDLRKQLCEKVSELAGLRLDTLPSAEELNAKREAISSLYYRFYDFTPKRVLQELNCLYACLGDRENRLYVIRNDELRLAGKAETAALIEDTSLLDNFRFYALVPLMSGDRDTRRAASINYQARRVLHVINQDLTVRSLLDWSRSPRK
ncbi:hypothetical protein AB0Q95_13230 [Streptomyces sp. NPDC059900]|uniref:hypothetical protein n=1 Tax=Streptomyces sp. NPDC059900 TaxID=3155816 RepID=UPI003443E9A7